MKFLSDNLIVEFDKNSECIYIWNPNVQEFPEPLVKISKETYSNMTLIETCEFVGSRILLLMPSMREHFEDEINRLAASEHGISR